MTIVIPNLSDQQFKIGNLIFGKYTTIRVEVFDVKPYEINKQDYQVSRDDFTRFGADQYKPTTIDLTVHVLYNKLVHPYESLIPNFWAGMPTINDLALEWQFDDGDGNNRKTWGALKPLFYCDMYGNVKIIFGRPGQFTYAVPSKYSEWVQCVMEYRRADTYAYGAYRTSLTQRGLIRGTSGEAASPTTIKIEGPSSNPAISVGSATIGLDYKVAAGETVRICSYPWDRTITSSTGENIAGSIVPGSSSLSRLQIHHTQDTVLSSEGGGNVTFNYRTVYKTL